MSRNVILSKKQLIDRLRSKKARSQVVLVFRGTGLNIWHYQEFLQGFSVEEMNDLEAIYGISGGAVAVWVWVNSRRGKCDSIESRLFDRIMRQRMNGNTWWFQRLLCLFAREPVYHVDDNLLLLHDLVSRELHSETFEEFPLSTYSVVAQDEMTGGYLTIDRQSHSGDAVARILSFVTTTSFWRGRPLCRREPYRGQRIADFDFATSDAKRAFFEELAKRHPGAEIYQLNIKRSKVDRGTCFVMVCRDWFPRLRQATDFLLFFLGIPNAHYRKTYDRGEREHLARVD